MSAIASEELPPSSRSAEPATDVETTGATEAAVR